MSRKLAEWAGWKCHGYEIYESERGARIADPYWSDPEGQRREAMPSFLHSLYWVIWKLLKRVIGGAVL